MFRCFLQRFIELLTEHSDYVVFLPIILPTSSFFISCFFRDHANSASEGRPSQGINQQTIMLHQSFSEVLSSIFNLPEVLTWDMSDQSKQHVPAIVCPCIIEEQELVIDHNHEVLRKRVLDRNRTNGTSKTYVSVLWYEAMFWYLSVGLFTQYLV